MVFTKTKDIHKVIKSLQSYCVLGRYHLITVGVSHLWEREHTKETHSCLQALWVFYLMRKNMKKTFIMYSDQYQTIKLLSQEEKWELLDAIYQYNNWWIDFEMSEKTKIVFSMMQTSFERNKEKYNSICDRNARNGAKWGRPRKNPKNPVGLLETQRNPEKPKKADSDSDSDSDIDIDSDIDSGSSKEKTTPPPEVKYLSWRRSYKLINKKVKIQQHLMENIERDYWAKATVNYLEKLDLYIWKSGKSYKNYEQALRSFLIWDGVLKIWAGKKIRTASDLKK